MRPSFQVGDIVRWRWIVGPAPLAEIAYVWRLDGQVTLRWLISGVTQIRTASEYELASEAEVESFITQHISPLARKSIITGEQQ